MVAQEAPLAPLRSTESTVCLPDPLVPPARPTGDLRACPPPATFHLPRLTALCSGPLEARDSMWNHNS